jgi:hypothetical protein
MRRNRFGAAAVAFDLDELDQAPVRKSAVRAMVRGRDGAMRSVDTARLAWPNAAQEIGVDEMADILRYAPRGTC